MRPAREMVFVVVMGSALAAARVAAQEPADVVAETYIKPVPIEHAAPRYPSGAAMRGQEGWVMLSFIVSPMGEVIEPMIEDSSGVEVIELAALEAVTGWRYAPATMNGEPVEQSMTKTRIVFRLDNGQPGATASFRRKYREIATLFDKGDFAAAEPLLAELEFGGRANLYEDAWFWWLKFNYLEATSSPDTDQKLDALRWAIGYEEDYLPPEMFVAAAQRLYVLQAQTRNFSKARNTFARLRDSKAAKRSDDYESAIAALTPSYERIEQLIAGNDLLVVDAEIGEHDYWVHDLLRRSFSMGDISGRVDVVDIRCDRGTKRYDSFPDDAVWRVPESWGPCGVYIKGEPGTTFVFEEYPLGATEATSTGD